MLSESHQHIYITQAYINTYRWVFEEPLLAAPAVETPTLPDGLPFLGELGKVLVAGELNRMPIAPTIPKQDLHPKATSCKLPDIIANTAMQDILNTSPPIQLEPH